MDMGLPKRQVLGASSPGIVFRNSDNEGQVKISNQHPNYGLTYTVTNMTERSVYVKDRLGSVMEIPQYRGRADAVICIEVTWHARREQLRNLMQQYEKYGAVNEFCRNAAEALYLYLQSPSNSSPNMRIFIDEDVLRQRNDAIYQPDLDLMLLFASRLDTEHPEGPMARFQRGTDPAVKIIQHCSADALIYAIEAVDSAIHPRFRSKYMSVGDQVYHVPVQHLPGSPEDGVIITRSRSADEVNGNVHQGMKYIREVISFEDAKKKFGIADTVDEARAMGDLKLQTERTIAELQLRGKVIDAENTVTKREIDGANLIRDRETADLKHYRERRKSDEEFAQMREKWQREREKLDQDAALAREKREWEREKALQDASRDEIRNTYEWIKVITGGLTILGTFLGLSRLKLA